ncbi:dynein regulatory complex subunit 3-like [Ctenocephalides felis]|uniref:dynein regulatory complex subunit 3-like n=1 Tax=Ctenocephalides felis TaxID=7515 RepID=UPI000E6E3EFA|nr:dynein regulatory complex subunit 3-like [Ctenocephalides felis]
MTMSINQVIHKNIEPGVINNEILMKALLEQGPQGESGRLYKEDNINFEEVKSIRLEFLNILKIDHLWMFTSLTKLNLSNNIIEEIENIEMLVNLKELDLSFNYITKIANLSTLVNIEVLSLYQNFITDIENIDSLKKLTILSIGNNEIEDGPSNILYLRQFPCLRSLNMAGNPCSRADDFNSFLTAFLPNLKYYEYRLIRPEERQAGMKQHGRDLEKLMEREADQKQQEDAKAAEEADHEFFKKCYVEYLNGHQFFLSLFTYDVEGQALLKIGESVQDVYNEYQDNMYLITQQIFKFGQKQHHIREEETKQFHRCIQETKDKNQAESQEATMNFMKERDRIFGKMRTMIKTLEDSPEIRRSEFTQMAQQCTDEFKKLMENAWSTLMEIEQILFEGIDEANTTFGHNMEEMVTIFIEGCQGYFVQAREAEVNYSGQVSEIALNYLTQIETQGPDPDMAEDLKNIMAEKDAVINAIAGSHDVHMQAIDAREDVLMQRIKTWLNSLKETLKRDEIARDRLKVLEINHFLDIQREEFESIQAHFNIPIVLDEIVDAVNKSNIQ